MEQVPQVLGLCRVLSIGTQLDGRMLEHMYRNDGSLPSLLFRMGVAGGLRGSACRARSVTVR